MVVGGKTARITIKTMISMLCDIRDNAGTGDGNGEYSHQRQQERGGQQPLKLGHNLKNELKTTKQAKTKGLQVAIKHFSLSFDILNLLIL